MCVQVKYSLFQEKQEDSAGWPNFFLAQTFSSKVISVEVNRKPSMCNRV